MKQATRFQKRDEDNRSRQTLLVIGGNGGLYDRYREVAAEHGFELRHYEKRVPNGARHGAGQFALVVVMVTVVSHALRDQARDIAGAGPVVYLKSPSVSSLRAAVDRFVAEEKLAA
jgi:hypothetical protein